MKVAVLTSGGDSPAMNADIRAITRVGIHRNCEVFGVFGGLQGILDEQIHELNSRSVSRILHRGGTILTTGRSEEFRTEAGQKKAAKILSDRGFDALIAIGGDGTMHALAALSKHWSGWSIGLPGTIDNDLVGTDYTIGFDTAVNNALEALDKIRDTATSQERIFVVEVMGRRRGFLALEVGLSEGAEEILIPEVNFNLDEICKRILLARKEGKTSQIIVMAEGVGDSRKIGDYISKKTKYEVRLTVLGHIQRGGAPTAVSRSLACQFGNLALKLLVDGEELMITSIRKGEAVAYSLEKSLKTKKEIDLRKYDLAYILSK